MEKLNNLELALIDEIDMIIESYWGEDEECNLTEEDKLEIAKDIINYEDCIWEELNNTIIDKVEKKHKQAQTETLDFNGDKAPWERY